MPMFGFLKKKLSEAVERFAKKAEEAVAEDKEILEEEKRSDKKSAPPTPKDLKSEVDEALEVKDKTIPVTEKSEKKDILPKKKTYKDSDEEIEKKLQVTEKKAIEELQELVEEEEDFEKADKEARRLDEEIIKEEETIEKIEEEFKEAKPKQPEKKGFFARLFSKRETLEEKTEKDTKEEAVEKAEKETPKGILGKISESISKVSLSEAKFEELFWDIEMSLLENNVAIEVIEKIKEDLKKQLVDKKFSRNEMEQIIVKSLHNSISELFDTEKIDIIKNSQEKKPYIIAMIGVNGAGKTTNLAKLVYLLQKNNLECVVGACDTFRAAAIQQLEEHTNRLGVKLIKHDYGSDPAAVAFDTVKHAQAKGKDVVLLDTAGRLHSNKNLMAELEKVIKVAKPDLKLFVGESIAGNDVVEQVRLFNDAVGIDAIMLTKADIDEKGGAAISVSYITGKPILFLGTGQGYDDLTEFDKERVLEQIGLT